MSHSGKGSVGLLLVMGVAAGVLLLIASPAVGGDLRAQEKAARKACLTGNYVKGVSILADMFVESRNPVHIFNQGRCYEQNRRYEDAIAQFEEYLRVAETNLPPDIRAKVEKHIADCSERLPNGPFPPQVQPPPTEPPTILRTPAGRPGSDPAPSETARAAAQSPTPTTNGQRRWGLVTAGIVAGTVGAGGILTGAVLNLKANNAASDINTKAGAYPSRSKDAENFKTYAWIGYATGAACLVSGAVLIALGAVRSNPAPSTEVAIFPAVGSGQLGATLTGVF